MATDIKFSYRDCPTIKAFHQSRAFIRGVMGPFGSAKSSGMTTELPLWASRQVVQHDGKKRARFAVIRNTYPQLRDTTMRTVDQWLPTGPMGFGTFYKAEHRVVIDRLDPNLEFEILFRALDKADDVANLLSLELTGAWVNEAREVPISIINALVGRVGRYPSAVDGGCVGPGIIMDTNPADTDSWWYKMFEEDKPDNAELFKQPGGMDPRAENKSNLPPGYYENMLQVMDESEAQVYVHGQYGFLKDGRPVFPGYNDNLHCKDIEYQPGIPVYRGWDFGLTPAVTYSQVLPNGQWNTFRELVAEEIFIDEFSDQVILESAQHMPGATFIDIGDPSGEQRHAATKKENDEDTCFKILHAKKIFIEGGAQNLTIRLESVRKPLRTMVAAGKPQLVVHSRCKTLRKGYQGRYQYKKIKVSGDERYRDEPDKNDYSHVHDGNQYIAARLFGDSLKTPAIVKQAVPLRRKAYIS